MAGLGILLLQGVLLAQPPEPPAAGTSEPPKGEQRQVRIFDMKYLPARELADLLQALSADGETNIAVDENTNRLIVRATKKRLDEVQELARALDVQTAPAPPNAPLLCRVYMLEMPPKDQGLKAFSLLLERPSPLPSAELLDALKDKELQVSGMYQEGRDGEDERWRVAIQGRAASPEAIKRVVEKIPGSRVKELEWTEETFTATVPAAQVNRLPSQLQEHLRKFLGDEIQTVGYWFGSLSSPGEVKAPIGPWMLELRAGSERRSEPAGDLGLEINVDRMSHIPFVPRTRLLSNSVQGKIGKPVIIGYNRDSYGTRTMGAVVILPEAEAARPDSPGKNAP
jgi:hypothetical protein